MNIFEVILSAARSKLVPIFGKIRSWFQPSFIKNRVLYKIRDFFLHVFDVRPKNEKDYYTIGWFMVSKKLAFAVVLLATIFSLFYIWETMPAKGDEKMPYKAYRHDSIALKFVSSKVEILGKSGYTAYIGDVKKGIVSGSGTLYTPKGNVVYSGGFEANCYAGEGKLYYDNTNLKYEGEFKENLYDGEGTQYREDGTLLYKGAFSRGEKSGEGELYDSGENLIYTGTFQEDEILYPSFLGKATPEIAEMYTGKRSVYQSETDYSVYMEDISAVYCGNADEDSLDGEWKVSGIYILKPYIRLGGNRCATIPEIKSILGTPVYEGNTNLTQTDEVALNLAIAERGADLLSGKAKLTVNEVYSDLAEVEDYERYYPAYLYVFEKEGITYQFFCNDIDGEIAFYSMEG